MTMGTVVGEMLASAVLKVVMGKLGAVIGPEVNMLWKFKDDLESIRSTLLTLQAVLNDAEKRSSREERVRLWLKRLKFAAYDIHDILEEMESNNDIGYGSFKKLSAHITIAHKMKKMRQRLEKIKEEAKLDIFNFKADCCSLDENVNSRATFSCISEDIVGRSTEKETIVAMLTTYSEEEILTICIYGFGGLGKTTLARLAFNDENVGGVFDYRVWVYVSMKFDLKKIGESILSEIDEGNCGHHGNLQEVTRHLQRVLDGKKFLVVLDDLWEDNWIQLQNLKAMLSCGAKGSKIVVTTRTGKIASLMDHCMPYKMDVLSDDDCWILFKRRAFVPGRDDPRIEVIGRDIVKKCNGVPLSAQALGFMMRFKEGVAAWEAVRDSEIWEIEDQNIMPSLKLSYCLMPCHLKLCFAYCVVFSKGAAIDKDMLIQQWIALGFIQPTSGSLTHVKRGEEYIRELVSMSFLQASMFSSSADNHHMKAARVFQMHDLVYDLARCVANEEFLFMDAKKSGMTSARNDHYRHIVLMNYVEVPMNSKAALCKAKSLHFRDCKRLQISGRSLSLTLSKFLRVLDISGCSMLGLPSQLNQMKQLRYLDASGMQNELKQESFAGLKCLNALNLSAGYFQKLPVQIVNLEKLHYLNLHGCSRLMLIPESICELRDLVHLDLSGCINLRVLPTSFGKLHKLSFLDMSGCLNLVSLPESFCDLRSLENLNLSSFHELRELPLGNHQELLILDMSNCHKIQILPMSFCNLLHLEDLNLSCCYELQELPEDFGKNRGLRILDLSNCHRLQTLPDSFTDLVNIEKLILSDCWELVQLPELLGFLQKIQVLDLSCCSQLFALPESVTKLTNLEHLNLSCCISLEKMPGDYGSLKKLKLLNISYCFKVRIPNGIANMSNLKCLMAVGLDGYSCGNKDDFNIVSSLLCMPRIDLSKKDSPIGDFHGILKHKRLHLFGLGNVQSIDEFENLGLCRHQQLNSLRLSSSYMNGNEVAKFIPDDIVLEKIIPPRTLEHFELLGYHGSEFPEWMLNLTTILPNLVHLKLSGLATCDHLPPLGQLPNLQSLVIECIPNVKAVGEVFAGGSRAFLKLRDLTISGMPNLERWLTTLSTTNEEAHVYVFPNLHHLKVSWCPKLIFEPSLPQCLLLEIDACGEILQGWTASHSQINLRPTRRLSFQFCDLSFSRGDQLHFFSSLSSLKFLTVRSCEGLDTWGESIGTLTSLEVLELSLCDIPMFLGRIASLQSLSIEMCHLPCDFSHYLLQLPFLRQLQIVCCNAKLELPGEITRAILARIPNISIHNVGCVRHIEQENGICQNVSVDKVS
ncbi:L-zip+NBS+LRR-like protein [Zea mays]|uniref:L-zip+NBS+LRR-like protein n=2 Tax=Zea mays TaxID=4577 RepID=A0A1D6GVB7_MAIZE|nr:L-zip+NBS+LRR-like protein [Zea mays]AQK66855.1 L-zip+NBS+LRR-like protein [Zea mays]AQK66856.1 L-zip+NBS+LRR-like protein [Zea mays]AQK66858.1 L-zip+NBS+LRR-like protein [Zea mays]AQK66859.1 L-zip+NBS+LRR-like protein [Zea mays]